MNLWGFLFIFALGEGTKQAALRRAPTFESTKRYKSVVVYFLNLFLSPLSSMAWAAFW